MAVEIQEPNDLPPNAITDENADRYEVLVYEKSPDVAGVKRLAIAGWKDYLGFNTHKVNNVASYLGMPVDYPWDSNHDVPYPDPTNHKFTVSDQIKNLSDKLGISTEPQTPFDPVYPRLQTLESQVQTSGTGLIDEMAQAKIDIQSLADEIGSGSGTGTTLTGRITALENTVNTPTTGLVDKVTAIENDIGDSTTTGTIKNDIHTLRTDVDALNTTVNDPNTGLVKVVGDNTTSISNIDTVLGDGTTSGLIKDVADNKTAITTLENTVGDSTNGLVKNVNDNTASISNINGILGDGTTDGLRKTVSDLDTTVNDPNDGLVKKVNDLESKVYFYKGNITDVTNSGDTTTAITVDGTVIQVSVANLKNGWVYNINPSASGVDSLIINGEKYNRGENVAIINDDVSIKFDKLGSNIDVEEVNKIAARYGSRSIAANTSYDIGDWKLPSGVYQFTLCATSGILRNISIVIVPILDGAVTIVDETSIVKITPDNFATYWEFTTGSLFVKSSAGLKSLTFTKIGEL